MAGGVAARALPLTAPSWGACGECLENRSDDLSAGAQEGSEAPVAGPSASAVAVEKLSLSAERCRSPSLTPDFQARPPDRRAAAPARTPTGKGVLSRTPSPDLAGCEERVAPLGGRLVDLVHGEGPRSAPRRRRRRCSRQAPRHPQGTVWPAPMRRLRAVAAPEREIARMEAIHERLFGTKLKPDPGGHERLGLTAAEAGMTHDAQTIKALRTAEPFDRAFVDEMIPHHKGAIKMATVVLRARGTENCASSPGRSCRCSSMRSSR